MIEEAHSAKCSKIGKSGLSFESSRGLLCNQWKIMKDINNWDKRIEKNDLWHEFRTFAKSSHWVASSIEDQRLAKIKIEEIAKQGIL